MGFFGPSGAFLGLFRASGLLVGFFGLLSPSQPFLGLGASSGPFRSFWTSSRASSQPFPRFFGAFGPGLLLGLLWARASSGLLWASEPLPGPGASSVRASSTLLGLFSAFSEPWGPRAFCGLFWASQPFLGLGAFSGPSKLLDSSRAGAFFWLFRASGLLWAFLGF